MTSPRVNKAEYDPNLHLFRETPVVLQLAVLRFYRWLAERGQWEHPVFGPSAGEWAEQAQASATHAGLTHMVVG